MSSPPCRFEFRVFAQDFGPVEQRLRRAGRLQEDVQESRELYLLARLDRQHNVKFRNNALEVKTLLGQHERLEQWRPSYKEPLPLSAAALREHLLPALGYTPGLVSLKHERYDLPQLLAELLIEPSAVVVAHVLKRRERLRLAGGLAEATEVFINGARLRTLNIEGQDPEALQAQCVALGLDRYPNVNYVLAFKRVVGMEPLPADCYYRAAI